MPKGLARCSLGHIGLVMHEPKFITYDNGDLGLAYTGWKLWPLHVFGKRWASRNPRWMIFFW